MVEIKLRTPRQPPKDCSFCGKNKTFSNKTEYCRRCSHFVYRMRNEKISHEEMERIRLHVREHGFTCEYTGIELNTDDMNSPWYCSFDHWIPRDPARVMLTSALFNAMKSDLAENEFWYYVLKLDDWHTEHKKFRKKPLVYWDRVFPTRGWQVRGPHQCPICARPRKKHHEYCFRCAKFGRRMKAKFPKKAIKAIWDYVRQYGYVCYYTGMRLNLDDPSSPWYCVFDHWIPGDSRKIVLTSSLLNEMKTDLTEAEFWYMIHQLANFRRYGTPIAKIQLSCWRRPYRPTETVA